MKVYISPSTQEHNIGAGTYGTEEKRMNQIANILIPLLDYNKVPWVRNRPEMSLYEVISESNASGCDLHVAIHSNAMGVADAGRARGCEIWIYQNSTKGRRIAEAIYSNLAPYTPTADRGIKESTTLAELKSTNMPSCIVEVSFHDNSEDSIWILNNMEPIAEAIAKGICSYYGVIYQSASVDYKAKYENLLTKINELVKGESL